MWNTLLVSLFLPVTILALQCGEFTSPNNILETRIVNGELASLGEFPWQVSIQRQVRAAWRPGAPNQIGNKIRIPGRVGLVELNEEELLEATLWSKKLWPKLEQINITVGGQIISWPPPLPTHPPGVTIPPLPTHPPHHTQPPLPTHPPLVPLPSQAPWAPSPPKQWPPPMPTHRPPGIPSLPPSPRPTLAPIPKPSRPPVQIDPTKRWQHFCGGSIIDTQWILTAAHCIESMKHTFTPGMIQIVAGSTNWRHVDEQHAQVIAVDRVIVHNGWTQQSGQNDVALLHLSSPIQYEQADKVIVNRVCLSQQTQQEHTGMATSSGWGFLNKDHRVTPEMLRRVDIPVVDHATCRNAFSRVIGISQNQVCAGQAPKGNCMGDSGGPLILKSGNRATQIGIVSFSIPCAVPGYPDVFTRVSKYIDWITGQTGINFSSN